MRKKDLTQFCRETNETHHSVSEKEFRHLWCRRCRNRECKHSTWGEGVWTNRMETQVDRLLDNPLFGDPRQEQFRHLQDMVFEDMKHHAIPIHIASENADWEIPSEKQVSDFEKGAVIGRENPAQREISISERKEEEVEEKEGLSEENPEKNIANPELNKSEEVSEIRPAPTIPAHANTKIEDDGIMIGGEESPPPAVDDWSVPPNLDNVIPVGGRVVMGSGNKGKKK